MAQSIISSGVVSSGLIVGSGTSLYVLNGGEAYDTTIKSGGDFIISSGGSASGAIASAGASVFVASDGAAFAIKEEGCYVSWSNGASVSFVPSVFSKYTFQNGYIATIHSGTTANSTTLNRGFLYVYDGGLVTETKINSGGSIRLNSGGEARDTVVNSGGDLNVYYGGMASNTVVSAGASVYVASDGSAFAIKEEGGYVSWDNGASVSFVPSVFSKYTFQNGYVATIHSGTTANSTTLNRGFLYVYDGGLVTETKINSGGSIRVNSGAEALDNIVNSGGDLNVYYGGMASNTVVSAGASVYVASDGSAFAIKEEGGYVSWDNGASVSFVPSVFSKYTFQNGYVATIHSGTTANSTTLNRGFLYVYNGGLVTQTKINSGGSIRVNSGAEALDNIVNSGGDLNVYYGGMASNTVVSAGASVYVASDGSALAIKEEGGYVSWDDGAVVSFVPSVFSKYTFQNGYVATIHSGTTANSTTLTRGFLYVYNGGLVTETKINSGGSIRVYSGAEALDNIVNSGADLNVYYGGMASNTVVSAGASVYVSSGGSALAIKEEGGYVSWDDGAVVSFVPSVFSKYTFQNGYVATIHSGTTANSTTLTRGFLYVYNGGLATETKINSGGSIRLYAGAEARDTIVNSGAALNIYNAGAATNAVVSAGASLSILSGGKLTGQVNILNGATVSASAGGVIDFDISELETGTETRVSNLSLVRGAPVYTLTVSGTQANLTYSLASGASGFNKTITVMNTAGTALGTLTLGKTEKISGVNYTLNLGDDNILSVTVSGSSPTPVSTVAKSDIDGNGVSDVMFVWTGNNYQHGYWMNGTSEWLSAGSDHPAEWENLGCYDMTGDGKADSVLVGNVEVGGVKGAYIGYYADANDLPDGSTWVNIGYLNNADDIAWKNKVGNLTGGTANSIVWYAPELYALGAWTDGTETWVSLSSTFGGDDWTLVGCGDFDGDGKDSVLMTFNGGQMFYAVDIGGADPRKMGSANWSGWDVRAIGDFSGDGKDDLVLFHKDSGSMVMFADGNADSYTSIGQLDANDWFVVGAGDYNADGKDDLLVRQYTTGMLGYYNAGDVANGWVELGRGVDMNWTVIA